MRYTAIASFFLAAALVTLEARAQTDNRNSLGRQVAIELCSSCHRVFEGQSIPQQNVPSFFAVANLPSTTALSLKVFLRSNHKQMPNLIISESDTDNVVEYILSLKR